MTAAYKGRASLRVLALVGPHVNHWFMHCMLHKSCHKTCLWWSLVVQSSPNCTVTQKHCTHGHCMGYTCKKSCYALPSHAMYHACEQQAVWLCMRVWASSFDTPAICCISFRKFAWHLIHFSPSDAVVLWGHYVVPALATASYAFL